jgi:hypothetical protein
MEKVNAKDTIILNEKEERVGGMLRATIEKSKFGPCPKRCEFKVRYDIGIIDTHEEVAQLGIEYGVIERPSTITYKYKELEFRGKEKFYEGLKASPELTNEILAQIVDIRESRLNMAREKQAEKKILIAEENSVESDLASIENLKTKKSKKSITPT